MMFEIYGDLAGWQLLGWLLVFVGLVVANEVARRSKIGGVATFIALPAILTVYFIVVNVAAKTGAAWAVDNGTVVYMNGWFHYAKLYAADAGCIGFMMLKYKWSIGKKDWFKVFPFIIVAINILIAVGSDFESAIKGYLASGNLSGGWWFSSEDVWLYGGWWNILNGLAGIIDIFCMTGWWGIYTSKDGKDMVWPDMTWCFIIAYDIWNFTYTYLNLPTHSWYCGVALLLAPTFANAFWNKGGWIQNRANTLAIWCMFAQVFPHFQLDSRFAVIPTIYGDSYAANNYQLIPSPDAMPTEADPTMQGVMAVLAIVANVVCLAAIIKRSKVQGKNPYTNDIFTDQKDYQEAMARVEA